MPSWTRAGVSLMAGATCALAGVGLAVATTLATAPQDLAGLPLRRLTPPRAPARAAAAATQTQRQRIEPLRGFEVRITAPAHDELVGGKVEIRARVKADRPEDVLFVEFAVDDRVLFADAKPPYELIWHARDPAAHRITARAYGPTGRVVQDVIHTQALPAYPGAAVFRSRVERVEVFVRVEDRRLRQRRLTATDFAVLENGVEQPIVAVDRSMNLPLAVGFMVDCSGSMIDKLSLALESAGSFIDGLMTQQHDKAFVMSFADLPSLLQEFTNDAGRLSDALELITTGRYTRLFDSLVAATRQFRGHEGRRALVILTDGHDVDSKADLDVAIEAAQRADVAIYPVAVDLSTRFFYERWVLQKLAKSTGGRVSDLRVLDDPERIFDAISRDLREQYRITYEPRVPGGDGDWRPIEVRLSEAFSARRSRLRARPGYFAE